MTAVDRARPGGARNPRVFLVGYYGVGNLGDEAIRFAIERAAERLGVDIPFYADRGASQDPRAIPTGVRGLPAQVRAIRATDRVVLGGGGILKDEGLRLPAELLVTALIARALRRPVTLLGVGVGPFYHRIGRWMVRAIARLSRVRTVRDESSVKALRDLGVTRVILAADPIFSTDSEPGLDADGQDRPVTSGLRATPGSTGRYGVGGREHPALVPQGPRRDRRTLGGPADRYRVRAGPAPGRGLAFPAPADVLAARRRRVARARGRDAAGGAGGGRGRGPDLGSARCDRPGRWSGDRHALPRGRGRRPGRSPDRRDRLRAERWRSSLPSWGSRRSTSMRRTSASAWSP